MCPGRRQLFSKIPLPTRDRQKNGHSIRYKRSTSDKNFGEKVQQPAKINEEEADSMYKVVLCRIISAWISTDYWRFQQMQ